MRCWLGKDGNRDVVRLGVELMAFLIALVTFVIGILVLQSYRRANALTETAVTLSRTQVMSAHVPWVGIDHIRKDAENYTFVFTLKNYSDSPAIALQVLFTAEGLPRASGDFREVNHILMPMDNKETTWSFTGIDSAKKEGMEGVLSGKYRVHCKLTYEDVFGRKFALNETIEPTAKGQNEPLGVTDTIFAGIEQLR